MPSELVAQVEKLAEAQTRHYVACCVDDVTTPEQEHLWNLFLASVANMKFQHLAKYLKFAEEVIAAAKEAAPMLNRHAGFDDIRRADMKAKLEHALAKEPTK